EVGNFFGGRPGPDGAGMEVLFRAYHAAHSDLRSIDYRGVAAKWRGRGSGRSIRRCGQPDGVWPARGGNIPHQGHYMVRHHVHDDVDGLDDAPEFDSRVFRQLRVAAVLKDVKANRPCGSCSSVAGTGSSGPGNTGAVEIRLSE